MNTLLLVAGVLCCILILSVILYTLVEYQEENRRRLARLDAVLKPASRCPECGHPVIAAPFCDETTYVCPDCAGWFVWVLDPKTGMYRLEQAEQKPQDSAQT